MGTDANRFIGRTKYRIESVRQATFQDVPLHRALCQPADLGRADFWRHKEFRRYPRPAGTYLDIHFGDGELESTLTAHAFLDAVGIKLIPRTCGTFKRTLSRSQD